mmetsp:Transcript_22941/g.68200  ORF Transcript_22941/g.68200 Transcript_22941/m.68200 type:complete len:216 (-) Transcript_22941:165-812(-)
MEQPTDDGRMKCCTTSSVRSRPSLTVLVAGCPFSLSGASSSGTSTSSFASSSRKYKCTACCASGSRLALSTAADMAAPEVLIVRPGIRPGTEPGCDNQDPAALAAPAAPAIPDTPAAPGAPAVVPNGPAALHAAPAAPALPKGPAVLDAAPAVPAEPIAEPDPELKPLRPVPPLFPCRAASCVCIADIASPAPLRLDALSSSPCLPGACASPPTS